MGINNKILKENSFDGAPAGGAGTSAYAPTLNTFSSPTVVQNPKNFHSSDANKEYSEKTKKYAEFSNTGSLEDDINSIFKKKHTPSPDDILSALQYELGRMITKDKTLAKQTVLSNIKKDPYYYRSLHMMNIDDKKMQVEETKKVIDAMIQERNKMRVFNEPLKDIMKEKMEEKKKRRFWSTNK